MANGVDPDLTAPDQDLLCLQKLVSLLDQIYSSNGSNGIEVHVFTTCGKIFMNMSIICKNLKIGCKPF